MRTPFKVLSTKICTPATIKKAADNKIELVEKPLITIQHTADEGIWQQMMRAFEETDQNAVFVFTSSNAIRSLHKVMKQKGYSWPDKAEVACLEGKTAALSSSLLNANILCTGKDAESLSNQIMLTIRKNRQIFFCSGTLRGDLLPDKMENAGYTLQEWKVYETRIEPEKLPEIYDGYLFFSPSGVISFLFANDWPENAVAVAIGSTTEAALKSSGISPILVASSPNEESLIDELIKYFTKQHT